MALSQGLYQKQLQKLSPQQIQLMKLLQVPTAQLEERIKEELEENPALEADEQDEKDNWFSHLFKLVILVTLLFLFEHIQRLSPLRMAL